MNKLIFIDTVAINVDKIDHVISAKQVVEEEAVFTLLNPAFPVISRMATDNDGCLPIVFHAVQRTQGHEVVEDFYSEAFIFHRSVKTPKGDVGGRFGKRRQWREGLVFKTGR